MSVYMKYQAMRWFAGGLFVIGLAITQMIFKWVGTSFFFKFIYPWLLLLGSVIFFWVGYKAWTFDDSQKDNHGHL